MDEIRYWLRWVAVFPGALLVGLLATFPLHWLFMFLTRTSEYDALSLRFFTSFLINKDNVDMIEYTLYPFIIALTFVFVGYKIAPKYKIKIAIVLFGVYLSVWLIVSFISLFKGSISGVDMRFSGRTVLSLVGAIMGLYMAKKDKTQKN